MYFFVVPANSSNVLRRFLEALFITHTEAQLNTDGHLDKLLFPDMVINEGVSVEPSRPWCHNLVRRPI
jgi:hypothetical protein